MEAKNPTLAFHAVTGSPASPALSVPLPVLPPERDSRNFCGSRLDARLSTHSLMHVVYVSRELPPEQPSGGIGSYVDAISEHLASRGHRVTIIAGTTQPAGSDSLVGGRRVIRVPWNDRARLPSLAHLAYLHRVSRVFGKIARESKVDVVECPEYLGQALFLKIASPGSPLTIRLHGGQEIGLATHKRFPVSPYFWLMYLLELVSINWVADHISVPSMRMWGTAERKMVRKKPIDLFPNPTGGGCRKR